MREISELTKAARRAEAESRTIGERVSHAQTVRALLEIRREVVEALREVRSLHKHACEWGDDDLCSICGADGRA